MSVVDINIIDAIGSKGNKIILLITDHLDWHNKQEHMILLQEKINSYLSFIENGEVYIHFPEAKSKKICIEVTAKYDLIEDSKIFMDNIKKLLNDRGYDFVWHKSI